MKLTIFKSSPIEWSGLTDSGELAFAGSYFGGLIPRPLVSAVRRAGLIPEVPGRPDQVAMIEGFATTFRDRLTTIRPAGVQRIVKEGLRGNSNTDHLNVTQLWSDHAVTDSLGRVNGQWRLKTTHTAGLIPGPNCDASHAWGPSDSPKPWGDKIRGTGAHIPYAIFKNAILQDAFACIGAIRKAADPRSQPRSVEVYVEGKLFRERSDLGRGVAHMLDLSPVELRADILGEHVRVYVMPLRNDDTRWALPEGHRYCPGDEKDPRLAYEACCKSG